MGMTDATPRREVPAWVFVLVILLCVGGGVGFVYWYFMGPSPVARQVTLKSPEEIAAETRQRPERPARAQRGERNRPQIQAPTRARPTPSALELVSERGNQRTYRVRGRSLVLEVVDRRNGEDRFTFRTSGRQLLNDEQVALASLRWRIMRDAAAAKYLNVQDWQMERLRQVEPNSAVVSEADQAQVKALWAELDVWSGRVDDNRVRRLVALLDEVGQRAEQATRARLAEQVERIKTILTPEQLDAWQKGMPEGGNPPVPPAPAAN